MEVSWRERDGGGFFMSGGWRRRSGGEEEGPPSFGFSEGSAEQGRLMKVELAVKRAFADRISKFDRTDLIIQVTWLTEKSACKH
jgi:hypothetical protein